MPEHRWHELEALFEREWNAKYGHTGLDWMEVRQAYRFGWLMGQRPEFRGRPFREVKDDLAAHWFSPEAATEEMAWDYIEEAVEEGYNRGQEEQRRAREGV